MILKKLLSSLKNYEVFGSDRIDVLSISSDSRNVSKGCLFVAIKGQNFDAHQFIDEVIQKGALVIVGEIKPPRSILGKVTYIKVPNSRYALGLIASSWFNNPSKKMRVIGVTGTDGKTTTVNLIYHLLYEVGEKVGMVSTINAKIGNRTIDTGFHVTNPDQILLQKLLFEMQKEGCKYAVLEVTSHGLDQERVAGVDFYIGVLTNITHEHLDYHKTLSNYIKAKVKLFKRSNYAVLNKEDRYFIKVKKLIDDKMKIHVYGYDSLSGDLLKAVRNKFPQKYNQLNTAASIETIKLLGINPKLMIKGITNFPGIIGRMEEVKNHKGIKIIIDFAHTPNALLNILTEIKKRTEKRLICVFGCAGERDVKKRPLMGETSGKISDITVLSAEDPRSENVNSIIKDIEKGIKKVKGAIYFKIPDRGEAIFYAINKIAKKGDTIVICGKGHERSMCYKNVEYPWSDHKAIEYALCGKVLRIKK